MEYNSQLVVLSFYLKNGLSSRLSALKRGIFRTDSIQQEAWLFSAPTYSSTLQGQDQALHPATLFGWRPPLLSVGSRFYVKPHLTRSGLSLRHTKQPQFSPRLPNPVLQLFWHSLAAEPPTPRGKSRFYPQERGQRAQKTTGSLSGMIHYLTNRTNTANATAGAAPCDSGRHPLHRGAPGKSPWYQQHCGRWLFPRGPHGAPEDAPGAATPPQLQGTERWRFL